MSKPRSFSGPQRAVQPRSQRGSSPSVLSLGPRSGPYPGVCQAPAGLQAKTGVPWENPSHPLLSHPRVHPELLPCRSGPGREAGKESGPCFTVQETEAWGWQLAPSRRCPILVPFVYFIAHVARPLSALYGSVGSHEGQCLQLEHLPYPWALGL